MPICCDWRCFQCQVGNAWFDWFSGPTLLQRCRQTLCNKTLTLSDQYEKIPMARIGAFFRLLVNSRRSGAAIKFPDTNCLSSCFLYLLKYTFYSETSVLHLGYIKAIRKIRIVHDKIGWSVYNPLQTHSTDWTLKFQRCWRGQVVNQERNCFARLESVTMICSIFWNFPGNLISS